MTTVVEENMSVESSMKSMKKYINWCCSRVPPHIDKSDLENEIALRFITYIPKFNCENGNSLSAYLKTHVMGAILDFQRKEGIGGRKRRTAFISLTSTEQAFEGKVIDIPDVRSNSFRDLQYKRIKQLFEEISLELLPKEWFIIRMYYWEEKTMFEIGEILEINESRVSQIHDRILQTLIESLFTRGVYSVNQLLD